MRKTGSIFVLVLLALAIAGCGANGNNEGNTGASAPAGENTNTGNTAAEPSGDNAAAAESETLKKAKEKGYITIGFANEKPYAYKEADGTLTGEAVEITKMILKRLGVDEVRGELTEFGSLIGGLQAKRFDMITAGMFVNPERCQAVLFANPEYSIGEALAVKSGNPLKLNSYKAIADNKKAKVAVMAGAVELGYLEKSGVSKDQMVIVPDQDAAISALQAGRVDAMTMTGPALQSRLDTANDDKLERVKDFEQPVIDGKDVRGYGASAFRQGDEAFRDAFNAELEKLKQSGELLTILKQFGFTEAEQPGDMTAEELCAG